MLILPQKVTVRWHNKTKKHYEEKGYLWTGNGEEFDVNVEDLKSKSNIKVKFKCDYCGQEHYKAYSYSSKGKTSCNDCKGLKISKSKTKYTYKDVKDIFERRGFTLLESEYLGYSQHHKYTCINGHKTSITFKNILKGRGCKECAVEVQASRQRYSLEFVRSAFEERGCVLISSEYHNKDQELDYLCVCGSLSSITFSHFFYRGQLCKRCGINKLKSSLQTYSYNFVNKTFEENDCVLLSKEYSRLDQQLSFICDCGREGSVTFKNFLTGSRCRRCFYDNNRGENHPRWNADLTLEERESGRNIEGYSNWRSDVYERDCYTCQCCGDNKGGNLVAHHLDGYDWAKDLRIDLENGITLCEFCHNDFHFIYGFGINTREQFDEYLGDILLDIKEISNKEVLHG